MEPPPSRGSELDVTAIVETAPSTKETISSGCSLHPSGAGARCRRPPAPTCRKMPDATLSASSWPVSSSSFRRREGDPASPHGVVVPTYGRKRVRGGNCSYGHVAWNLFLAVDVKGMGIHLAILGNIARLERLLANSQEARVSSHDGGGFAADASACLTAGQEW